MRGAPGVLVVLLAVAAQAQNVARPCQYDSNCVENAYCVLNTYCRCKEGFVINGSHRNNTLACLKEAAAMGDPCDHDIQCSRPFGAHARCLPGAVCGCREGAHFREDLCYPSVRIGGQCTVRNDCRVGASTMDAACVRGACLCQPGFHGGSGGRDCLPDILLGHRCQASSDCSAPNATCSAEVCRCPVSHVPNSRNTRCLPYAFRLGTPCEEDIQCSEMLENSVCDGARTCSCPQLYHAVSEDSWCWFSVRLGGACSNWRECVVAANRTGVATCGSAGVCECGSGLRPSDDHSDCISSGMSFVRRPTSLTWLAIIIYTLLAPT
ncbi:multiple epidermal growth factor-like domains protein 10 [Bacillus rossius redtenbacheri]|uniref:multiple epidermal growth factor-like domains protein 10 n=1 Tax=Bacillus rossius redtenbacheri TaxID=93214 RepID=UPI002FDCE132